MVVFPSPKGGGEQHISIVRHLLRGTAHERAGGVEPGFDMPQCGYSTTKHQPHSQVIPLDLHQITHYAG